MDRRFRRHAHRSRRFALVLVDTSVLIDYLRLVDTPATQALENFMDSNVNIILGDLVVMELLQGASSEKQARGILEGLKEFQIVSIAGPECAIIAARHYRTLRSKGVTIRKTIDTLIATRCIMDNIPLLYSDRDFDPFVTHLGLKSALPA